MLYGDIQKFVRGEKGETHLKSAACWWLNCIWYIIYLYLYLYLHIHIQCDTDRSDSVQRRLIGIICSIFRSVHCLNFLRDREHSQYSLVNPWNCRHVNFCEYRRFIQILEKGNYLQKGCQWHLVLLKETQCSPSNGNSHGSATGPLYVGCLNFCMSSFPYCPPPPRKLTWNPKMNVWKMLFF